ncbi:MAG: VWA-like domain-containing protein [Thermoproteota archaeon]
MIVGEPSNYYKEQPEEKLDRIIRSLFDKGAFYYYVTLKMFSINYVEKLPYNSPAATDGNNLYVTEDFFRKYSIEEQALILAHEAVHAMYRHPERGEGRNPLIWNFATDAVVNRYVVEDFKEIIPSAADIFKKIGAVTDKVIADMFDLDENVVKNQIPEEIYSEIMQKADQNKQKQMDKQLQIKDMEAGEEIRESERVGRNIPREGLGGGGGKGQQKEEINKEKGLGGRAGEIGRPLQKGDLSDELKNARTAEEIKEVIRRAADAIKRQAEQLKERYAGKGGGSFIEEIIPSKPKLNFAFLRIYLDKWYQGEVVQSYKRYNRRFIMLPSTAYIGSGQIYVLLDVSGSISSQELAQAAAEIDQLARKYGRVEIYQWDSGIRSAVNVTHNLASLKVTGRGGTELAPAVKQLATQKRLYFPQPTKPALIIFSDFELSDEDEARKELQKIANNVFLVQVSYTGKFLTGVYPSVNIKV